MDYNHIKSWPISIQTIVGGLVLGIAYYAITGGQRPYTGIPIIQLKERKGWISWLTGPSASDYQYHCSEVLAKGRKTNGCFQVKAGNGYKIVVPNRFADELRNHHDLSFRESGRQDFMADYQGFDGFRQGLRHDGMMVEIVRVKLTQSLGLVTEDIVDEADKSVRLWMDNSPAWKTYRIKDVFLDVVARVSTRIFAGEELAHDTEWLHIAKQYTVAVFQAAHELLRQPSILRPVAQYFQPMCTELRKQVKDSRRIVLPQAEKRMKQREQAINEGKKSGKSINSFDWMVDTAKGRPYDFSAGQLMLSLAAIHTTTEMSTRALLQVCEYPEVVQPLRDEMVAVLREDGWAKTSLYKMKLLDSFMKEVSRYSQLGETSMMRVATKIITLSDGTVIPKRAFIMLDDNGAKDPDFYAEPEKFDAWRYLKMRERPGEENKHQFVTTSPDNMLFGHGQHACPGRFFASNEIKILFCFFLLKYDFRFVPGRAANVPLERKFENMKTLLPNIEVQARPRKPEDIEIDLLNPKIRIIGEFFARSFG